MWLIMAYGGNEMSHWSPLLLWESFVLSNLFRVRNSGIRSRHLVYRSKNHKYDFMHKRTSLELGPELIKVRLGKLLGTQEPPNLMVVLPLYYLIS